MGRSPLWALLSRRVAHGLLLLLVLSVASFALAEMAPGDLVTQLELDPRISPSTLEQLRQRYGLDAPLIERYGHWLGSMVVGEFGYSLAYRSPVGALLAPRWVRSLTLACAAGLVAWSLALISGLLAARRRGSWLDRLIMTLHGMLLAVPDLLLALAALYLAARTGLFPLSGMQSLGAAELSPWAHRLDRLWHLALPALALALGLLPGLAAHVRYAFIQAYDAPSVRAARGHGIGRWRLFRRYALRLAAPHLIHLGALSFATLMSGSLIVEIVLGWPGLGPLLLEAILARDTHVVLAGALLSAAGLLLANLVADVAAWHMDPRLDGAPLAEPSSRPSETSP